MKRATRLVPVAAHVVLGVSLAPVLHEENGEGGMWVGELAGWRIRLTSHPEKPEEGRWVVSVELGDALCVTVAAPDVGAAEVKVRARANALLALARAAVPL